MASRKLRQENNFSGGINQGVEPFALNPNESADEFGFDTDDHPFISTAKGRTAYGASGGAETRLLTAFGQTRLIRAVGTKLQWDNAGVWADIPGTFANADWDATMFEVNGSPALILTNGIDNVLYTTNGTTVSNLSVDAPKGKYITNDTIRVWIAKDDMLFWSKFLDATNWTATEDAGSVQYFTERGGNITALKNFYGDKYVWKKDSMAVVQGKNFFTFKLEEISNDIGCVSFKTVQEVGDTLYWLGENDVYEFRGGLPRAIGQPIRKYLDRINPSQIDKCCAITDGIRYYLCLVVDSNTEPTVRLVYDPRYKIWRVPGLNENYRYSVRFNNVAYVGDASGQTYKFNDIPGTGNWSITMGPYDEGFPEAEKIYAEMHLQGHFPAGTTLELSVSTTDRGDDFVILDNDLMNDSEAQNDNILIPFDTVPLTHWLRYKLSGSGAVTLYRTQRYFRTAAVQR